MTSSLSRGPGESGADVVLEDGSLVRVRGGGVDDGSLIAQFVRALSDHTFCPSFAGETDRGEALRRLAPSDENHVLLAEREGRVIGLATYHKREDDTAEVWVVVHDEFRGRGLGTILLGELAESANSEGVVAFEAVVSPENSEMLRVFRDLGFPASIKAEPKAIRVTFPTSVRQQTLAAFDRREANTAIAALQMFLRPQGLAVIGASHDPRTIGGMLFKNIVDGEYKGSLYAVNPKVSVVQGFPAYGSVLDCQGPVDQAIIVVPASVVLEVADECARKGVKALTVISSGFAEIGEQGAALQQRLVETCRESGMRLIGPNCMGIVNTDPLVRLNGQFSSQKPTEGRIGFMSQSGALGITVIDHANRLGLGMSTFVSVGNKADISGNDLIQYWESDERTRLILLYLEAFGNPRKFSRVARSASRKKPIIAVKSGRSPAGFRATQSHTGAMLAASDVTVDELFRQAGVIRVDTLGEMFDVASLLVSQPVPRGRRIAIVTNAGGAGILAADAAEGQGLQVPELDLQTQDRLRSFLSPYAGVRNPVDMIASATAADYSRAIEAVSNDPRIDAIVALFVPPVSVNSEDVAKKILEATKALNRRIPVLATFMAYHGISEILSANDAEIPSYPFPEGAIGALAKAVSYGEWLSRPVEEPIKLEGVERERAARLISGSLSRGAGWLTPDETEELLRCYGIPVVKTVRANSLDEVVRAAAEIGGKLVLKGVAEGLVHKSDAGAVVLDLSPEQVGMAARDMLTRLSKQGFSSPSFLLQPMVSKGVEMFVGLTNDPTFGPLVACGAGGTLVELLKDVSFRLSPITPRDANQMVRGLRTFPLLEGYRGGPKYDARSVEEVILRVSALAEDHQAVTELDLNPLMVRTDGASVVDFRVRVEDSVLRLPLGAKKR